MLGHMVALAVAGSSQSSDFPCLNRSVSPLPDIVPPTNDTSLNKPTPDVNASNQSESSNTSSSSSSPSTMPTLSSTMKILWNRRKGRLDDNCVKRNDNNSENTPMVAVIAPATSKGIGKDRLGELPLMRSLLPSLYRTMSRCVLNSLVLDMMNNIFLKIQKIS